MGASEYRRPRAARRDLPAVRRPPNVVTRTRNPVLRGFHILASLLGWVLFAYFWYGTFARPLDRRTLPTFALLGLVLIGIIIVNALWVSFNKGIYRSRGQRTQVPMVGFEGVNDYLGRILEGADWPQLRREAWIRIAIEGNTKSYHAVSGPADSGRPAL
jgi:hypothetical protein